MCPHAALLQRLLIAILALAMPLVASGPVRAEDNGATARGMFTMLPTSIFETTAEGLSEADKQRLLAEGRTEFWEIAGETSDVLVFASLPFRDRAVGLRLFHNTADGSTEVPIDTPQEPDAREFLGKGEKLPGNVTPTVLICLGLGGLKAVPVFWSSKGQVDVPLRNDVSFQWTGKGFEKRVTPREAGSR